MINERSITCEKEISSSYNKGLELLNRRKSDSRVCSSWYWSGFGDQIISEVTVSWCSVRIWKWELLLYATTNLWI